MMANQEFLHQARKGSSIQQIQHPKPEVKIIKVQRSRPIALHRGARWQLYSSGYDNSRKVIPIFENYETPEMKSFLCKNFLIKFGVLLFIVFATKRKCSRVSGSTPTQKSIGKSDNIFFDRFRLNLLLHNP